MVEEIAFDSFRQSSKNHSCPQLQNLREDVTRYVADSSTRIDLLILADEALLAAEDATSKNRTAFRRSRSISADWEVRSPALLNDLKSTLGTTYGIAVLKRYQVNIVKNTLQEYSKWLVKTMGPLHEDLQAEDDAYERLGDRLEKMEGKLYTARNKAITHKYHALRSPRVVLWGPNDEFAFIEKQLQNLNTVGCSCVAAQRTAKGVLWLTQMYLEAAGEFDDWLQEEEKKSDRFITPAARSSFIGALQGWVQDMEKKREDRDRAASEQICAAPPRHSH